MNVEKIDKKITDTQQSIENNTKTQLRRTDELANQIEDAATTLHHVSNRIDTVNTTIMSFRDLGIQLLQM